MQKDLHIDRASREREAERATDVGEVLAELDAAGEFAEKNSVPITHVCKVEGIIGESTFRFGAVVWAFMELPFSMTATCPRCGKAFVVEHTPSAEDLKAAAEPDWVAMEEATFAAREAALAQGMVPPSMEQDSAAS